MGRKWHSRDTGPLTGVDLDAVVRRQVLTRMAVHTSGALITATDPRRYVCVFAENVAMTTTLQGRNKIVSQVRQLGEITSPLLGTDVADEVSFPADNVINIQKGMLRRR